MLIFFLMIRRPPRSTLFPTRRSSDLAAGVTTVRDMANDIDQLRRLIDVVRDRKSTRLNSSHVRISYAVFCLKKKKRRQYATGGNKLPRKRLRAAPTSRVSI